MPGRQPGPPPRPHLNTTAFASVPPGRPAPGCTAMPGALSSTTKLSSSAITVSGRSSGSTLGSRTAGTDTSTTSPSRTLAAGRVAAPLSRTAPS